MGDGLDTPRRIAFGGRSLTTFVLDKNSLAAIDRSGAVRYRITLLNQVLMPSPMTIFEGSWPHFLRNPESCTPLVMTFGSNHRPPWGGVVPGTTGARTQIGIDPVSGTYWLHKSGATSLVKVTSTVRVLVALRFRLVVGAGTSSILGWTKAIMAGPME